jgi:regulator of PEP synthase PpsR (kinase-PPPase family)
LAKIQGASTQAWPTFQKEIDFANDLFKKNKRWPVFNVTDRALEETAAEIVRLVAARMDIPYGAML